MGLFQHLNFPIKYIGINTELTEGERYEDLMESDPTWFIDEVYDRLPPYVYTKKIVEEVYTDATLRKVFGEIGDYRIDRGKFSFSVIIKKYPNTGLIRESTISRKIFLELQKLDTIAHRKAFNDFRISLVSMSFDYEREFTQKYFSQGEVYQEIPIQEKIQKTEPEIDEAEQEESRQPLILLPEEAPEHYS